jgi:hypothetical protein
MSDAPASETTTIHALDISVEERRVRSFDGTDIAYHTVGEGPPVLLANGLGGSWKAWSHQIRHFRSRHRFISWDQRGLFRSGAPADPAALDIPAQARDAVAVLDAAGVEQCLVFGWSMGVQTTLELWRRAPERIAGMVLINGVAGSPWTTLPDLPKATVTAPLVLRGLRRVPDLVSKVTRTAVSWQHTPALAKRLGFAASTLDVETFRELAGSFAGIDMGTYVRTLEQIGEHDAHDVLPTIRVPLLMVAGGRDRMTPRIAAERIARDVPGAELTIVPGATHYVAVEYPGLLNLRVERFLRERCSPKASR